MHSFECGWKKRKGIWIWDEGEMNDQSCTYKGHDPHTSGAIKLTMGKILNRFFSRGTWLN